MKPEAKQGQRPVVTVDVVIFTLRAGSLQVLLVQGPADRLKMISDRMIACRGVITGKLLMSTAILPPVHTQLQAMATG